ncbi:MAG: SH3 domain-containing protein [Anaerolineaceae bacterium]
MQLVCKLCGKAILSGTDYQECPICKRVFHIGHDCPMHNHVQMNIIQRDSNRRIIQNPRRVSNQRHIASRSNQNNLNLGVIGIIIILVIVGLLLFSTLNNISQPTNSSLNNSDKINSNDSIKEDVIIYPTRNTTNNFSESDEGEYCNNAPKTRLAIGDKARVTYRDNTALCLRSEPRISKQTWIKDLAEGTRLTVLSGPVCSEGYFWWKIETREGAIGWVAEGEYKEYYLEIFDW